MKRHGVAAAAAVIVLVTTSAPVMAGAQVPESAAPGREVAARTALPQGPPFRGVHYFYVASQKRYRAVWFTSGGWEVHTFSSGFEDTCFVGTRRGYHFVGTVYNLPYGRQYRASMTYRQLVLGTRIYSAPGWFRNKVWRWRHGNGVCS